MTRRVSRILHRAVRGIAETVRVEGGTTVYVSGTVGLRPGGEPAADFAEEVGLALGSLRASLERQGAGLADIVRLDVYVVGLDDERIEVWHRVRDEWMAPEDGAAATLLGVAALYSPAVSIEIAAIAVI